MSLKFSQFDPGSIGEELSQPTKLRLRRLLDYWNEKRGNRPMPSRADIDPLDFQYLLGDIAIVDVIGDPPRFHFRLFGSNLVARLGADLTGKTPGDHPDPMFGEVMNSTYREVVEKKSPTMTRRRMIGLSRNLFQFEVLRLPLSSDGKRVDKLLIGVAFDDEV